MPCEACNIQFTVFKRKKSCTECRRLYCSNCLTKNKDRILCKRCVIFTTRPLSKIELLKLKAKDLIFYLQSKHISTTGCVEKEELVNLVLIHVGNSNNFSPDPPQQSPTSFASMGTDQSDDARSNPFDQIRNTCQNLFSTFTEKIASDFNFEFKPNQSDRQSNVCEDQPRYSSSFRNVPTCNSNTASMNGSTTTTTATSATGNGMRPQRPTTITSSGRQNQQSPQFEPVDAFNDSAQNHAHSNTQSSPTITGQYSSSASTSSLLKSPSQHSSAGGSGDNDAQNSLRTSSSNGSRLRSPPCIPTASTSTNNNINNSSSSCNYNNRPTCAKITQLTKNECCNDAGSGCECSDDELIAKFRESYGDRSQPMSPITPTTTTTTTSTTIAKASTPENVHTANSKTGSTTTSPIKTGGDIVTGPTLLKEETSALESSDISSFEDLGAVGGSMKINTTQPCDTDKWQIVNPTWNIDDTASTSSLVMADDRNDGPTNIVSYTTNLPNSIPTELPQANNASENQRHEQTQNDDSAMANETFQTHSTTDDQRTFDLRTKLEKTLKSRQTHRKITRRQSDGVVYTASTSRNANQHRANRFLGDLNDDDDDVDDDDTAAADADASTSTSGDDVSHKRSNKSSSCRKCGKTKGAKELKKYIARFRHQLEATTSLDDEEIKQQLDAFLAFLEGHSAFDDESTPNTTEMVQSPSQFVVLDDDDDDDYDDEAGIHVYGSNDDSSSAAHPPRQFFNLSCIEKKEDLDDLSVKQLKEVLMLNRVDFRGCCEKSELLERVQRLWDDLQNCPAVDKLPTVDLCKICMDAAIECVLLECGHMATCTNCGKVLSECPICRQYIVRIVRFFKA